MNKRYGIEEVFELLGNDIKNNLPVINRERKTIIVDGYKVYSNSWRYKTFYHKGCNCVRCGRKGSYFKLDAENPKVESDRRHFNLYSEDGVLMTKDHILPKSKGGKNILENFQTMCFECNCKKGNKYETVD